MNSVSSNNFARRLLFLSKYIYLCRAGIGGWYEDRDKDNKRYGRRTGSYSDPIPGGIDDYHGNGYTGWDRPRGFPPGFALRFRLIVVDVCNGGSNYLY